MSLNESLVRALSRTQRELDEERAREARLAVEASVRRREAELARSSELTARHRMEELEKRLAYTEVEEGGVGRTGGWFILVFFSPFFFFLAGVAQSGALSEPGAQAAAQGHQGHPRQLAACAGGLPQRSLHALLHGAGRD